MQGLYTQSCRKGKLLPQPQWKRQHKLPLRGHGHNTKGLPQHPDTPPASAWTTCTQTHSWEGFSVLLSWPPSCRTDISPAPVPQPPGQCWWSSPKQRPLSSASTLLCCSHRNSPYPSFRFSAAFFPSRQIRVLHQECNFWEISHEIVSASCKEPAWLFILLFKVSSVCHVLKQFKILLWHFQQENKTIQSALGSNCHYI